MNVSLLEGSSRYLLMMKSLYSLYILGVLVIELPSKNSFSAALSVSWISSHANQPEKQMSIKFRFSEKLFSRKKKGG